MVAEFFNKFGYWIGIGVAIVGAVLFWAFAVRPQEDAYQQRISEVQRIQSNIRAKDRGTDTPNEKFIQRAREMARLVEEEIAKLQRIIVSQRRKNHTKLFWHPGDPTRSPAGERSTWRRLHTRYVNDLMTQVERSGLASSGLVGLSTDPVALPSWTQIRNDQIHFWLTKDLLHLLMNQAEEEVRRMIREHAEPRLASLFDAVKNPEPGQIAATLQTLEEDRLVAVLEEILVNEAQDDLYAIFERHNLLSLVERHVVTDYQAAFLSWLGNPNTNDRADLVDYIEDIRWTRYRDDLVALYRNHNFPELARTLQNWGPETPRILGDDLRGPNWRPLRLAQAIETAVSISSEKDLNVILANHRPRVVSIERLNIPRTVVFEEARRPDARPGVRPREDVYDDDPYDDDMPGRHRPGAPGERARGLAGVYHAFPFDLAVVIEFRRVPILVRRLLRSDWRIEIDSVNIAKTTWTPQARDRDWTDGEESDPYMDEDDVRPPTRERPPGLAPPRRGLTPGATRTGRQRRPGVREPREPELAPDGPRVPPETEPAEALAPPSNYVRLELAGEARQFYPLWARLNPEEAKDIEERFQP